MGSSGQPQVLLGQLDLVVAERRAVGPGRVLLVRRAEADVRAHRDQRGPPGLCLRGGDGRVDGVDVVAVGHLLHVPVVGGEARADVLGEGEVGGAVDGDVVVVVEDDELAELLVAGERGGLAADALHHVAVAGEDVGEVVHDVRAIAVERRAEEALGDGHADGVGEALAEGPGGRLDAGRVPVLGVTGRPAAPLAERAQVVEAEVVARQMEQGVEQHAAVAGREHEAVAVGPRGVGRVEAQVAREQRVGRGRGSHGHAGMAGLGLLHAVDGEKADGVDAALLERLLCWPLGSRGSFRSGCQQIEKLDPRVCPRCRRATAALPLRGGRAAAVWHTSPASGCGLLSRSTPGRR